MPSSEPLGSFSNILRQHAQHRWQQQQSQRQILRSLAGFPEAPTARPLPCRGCQHYHGLAYGYSRDRRTMLICAFHPYGWQSEGDCPDWQDAAQ